MPPQPLTIIPTPILQMRHCKCSHSFIHSFFHSFFHSKTVYCAQRSVSLSSSHTALSSAWVTAVRVCLPCVPLFGGDEVESVFMVELRPAGWRERGAAPVLSACRPCVGVFMWPRLRAGISSVSSVGEGKSRCALAPGPARLWKCLLGLELGG